MEYGKNTIQEFAEMLQENIQAGESQSNIIQMIEDWQKPLVHHKDTTVGLYVVDKMIDDIFTDTPEEKDCETVVEAYLVQQYKRLKSLMWQIS